MAAGKHTSGSEPSQRRAAMQPCSNLLTMDLVHSSTVLRSWGQEQHSNQQKAPVCYWNGEM